MKLTCLEKRIPEWLCFIKVDGLEPTEDFKEYIEKEKRGEITPEDVRKYLDKKYKMKET